MTFCPKVEVDKAINKHVLINPASLALILIGLVLNYYENRKKKLSSTNNSN